MTTESIVTSCIDEKKWVNESIRTFTSSEFKIDIEPAKTCVFQVPKTITKTKPQAYAPQKVGLGPYHHLRPEFLANERHKLKIAKTCLKDLKVQDLKVQHFVEVIINKLCSIEPIIQAYYDKYLDLEDKTLVWILAIDSLYLVNLLSSYVPEKEIDNERRELAQDVIMLENQIPRELLIETGKTLNQSYDNLFTQLFHNFCKAHSPLKLTEQNIFLSFKSPHLLAYLHNLIINNLTVPYPEEKIDEKEESDDDIGIYFLDKKEELEYDDMFVCTPDEKEESDQVVSTNCIPDEADESDLVVAASQPQMTVESLETIACFVPGGELAKPVSFVTSLPWDRIKELVKKEDEKKEDEKKPLIEEIEIPSVTELNKIAKINFKVTIGGIRDIKFVEEEEGERVFYLPEITLHSDSEVILRNLVAYEAAIGGQDGTLEFAEYVDLMCGIVDTPNDVDLLKKSDIIKGSLSDEEITDLFNGISKTTGKYKEKKSELELAIETVNEKFDNIFRVKAHKFIKKHIYKSWKFLSVLSTVVLIILLSVQAFCLVYGCSSRWFHPTK